MLDKCLDLFQPMIEHMRETSRQYERNPTDANKVVMELARYNVYHATKEFVERILTHMIFNNNNKTEE